MLGRRMRKLSEKPKVKTYRRFMIHLTGVAKVLRERMWGSHLKVIILRTFYAQYIFSWHHVLPSREGEEKNSHPASWQSSHTTLQTSGHVEETNIRGPVAEEGSLAQAYDKNGGRGVRRVMQWLLWKPARRWGRQVEQGDRAIRQVLIDRLRGRRGVSVAVRDGNGQGRRESCREGPTPGQHCVSFLAGPGQSLRIWNGTRTGKMCILEDTLTLCREWTGSGEKGN